ncbi:MAG: hypothetical protein N2322_00955 [Terrimicrobiaceae bacterium]|nr:hypothetical protein [Terrimicrobiaceae bacterium]
MSLLDFLRSRLAGEPPVHPIERRLAKRWVKDRLKKMYPELRGDPRALEAAYQALTIEAHAGAGEGGEALFEVILPGRVGR